MQQFLAIWITIYHILSATAFLWAPFLLIWLAQKLWLEYVRAKFVYEKFKFIMLEVKLPRTIDKTPMAMELVLQSLHQGGEPNWYEKWWLGKVKPWFSLELISVEGTVHFFIRTPAQFKKIIESHVFAQYPDVELHEVQDYISLAPYMHEKGNWELWGCEYKLTKPDPYPIKTYVDFGLDSTMTKEEFKSDPISSTIEFLGSIGRGQQVWIQILVQSTSERFKTPDTWFQHHDWKDEGKRVIHALKNKAISADSTLIKMDRSTKREQEIIHAIEKSLGKIGFDCGIRALYIAQKDKYDPTNIAGLIGAFRQYNSEDLNGFRHTFTTGFDYPWQDFNNIRLNKRKHKLFDAYARRSYFYPPYKQKPFVLNSEELATIYHFPGGVSETPTFSRIESRKGEPPSNLPI